MRGHWRILTNVKMRIRMKLSTTASRQQMLLSVMTMNADMSKIQTKIISLQSIRDKSFATCEESGEDPTLFFWENDVLRRKWQSVDGLCGGEHIVVPAGLRKIVMEL
ncbi:hypothetical protein CHS0354_017847, partial [Potamilus streckersoni]